MSVKALNARTAKDTVLFMTESVREADALGRSLIQARENTKHFRHEDTVVLQTRSAEELYETVREVTREDTLLAAKRSLLYGKKWSSDSVGSDFFLKGSRAQEERLSRCTGLYWCINEQAYYERNINSEAGETQLYLHDILYSPRVPVIRDLHHEERLDASSIYPISVLTAPAPKAHRAIHYCSSGEIAEVMGERIRRILTVMANEQHKALVLGAFGCGVFRNNPQMVAMHFKTQLEGEFRGYFKKIILAVYEREGGPNITTFSRILFDLHCSNGSMLLHGMFSSPSDSSLLSL